jgi:hypothetical protein
MYFLSGVFAALLGFLGCAGQTLDDAAKSQHAKYILVAALDAWKAGHVESLAARTPSIRFADHDQRAGMELVDYEFENEAAQIRPFQNVRIVLSLRDKQGQTNEKTVTYQVGVEPALTVLRSDN